MSEFFLNYEKEKERESLAEQKKILKAVFFLTMYLSVTTIHLPSDRVILKFHGLCFICPDNSLVYL